MSKAPKAAATDEQPKKSKKLLVIIIAAAVLLVGSGAAAFLLLKPAHPAKEGAAEAAHSEVPPKFVELGTFTANLIHEEGDRYLQIAISLKVTKPELEEKIKANNPEILHRVNMLLQSKRPSELATIAGKEKLAQQIKAQVEYVLGFSKTPPVISSEQPETTQDAGEHTAPPAPATTEKHESKSGVAEVLFTSFIIQ